MKSPKKTLKPMIDLEIKLWAGGASFFVDRIDPSFDIRIVNMMEYVTKELRDIMRESSSLREARDGLREAGYAPPLKVVK